MELSANSLERAGFTVNDRNPVKKLDKIVGYEIVRSPPALRFPKLKGEKLRAAMLWLISCDFVFVDAVASTLGIWVHGALLRRELLAAANHVFSFVDKFRGLRAKWWPSARK